MIDATVPISRACATAAWSLASIFLIAAWVTFALGFPDLCHLLGNTAIVFVGLAAVLTIRGWVSRVCNLVRLSASRESADGTIRTLR